MYNAASHAGAESFPVLKAFQDYIEAERAQARKRVMQLSIFFAVLMCVVVTGFLTAGIFMLRNMSTVQTKLLDVALAQKTAPAPLPPRRPPRLSPSPRPSTRSPSAKCRAPLPSSVQPRQEAGRGQRNRQPGQREGRSQNSELEKLRGELKQMQAQSATLKKEIASLKSPRPTQSPTGPRLRRPRR
jgi:cell division protein FtsB